MTEPARPAPRRAPGSMAHAIRGGLLGGLRVFALATAIGVAIAMVEFAASGGAYRLWTWVKVGFLYVVSFCTAALRVTVLAPRANGVRVPEVFQLRFAFLLGTFGLLWVLARVGRSLARAADPRVILAGSASAVVGFAVPVFVIALPATLRFPGLLDTDVAPVLWQAALFPAVIAAAGVGAGVFLERRNRATPSLVAVVLGGWRMFVLALVLAFVGFLLLAAVKIGPTGAYAREMQSEGRVGVLSVTHHLLLLPNQSMWIVGPSMGGSTEIAFGGGDPSIVSVDGVSLNTAAAAAAAVSEPSIHLGGGFYLFLLVPAVATVAGGRSAGRTATGVLRRMGLGAGAGVVFALLIAAASWASAATIPIPALGWAPVSVRTVMPSTVVIALAWGVLGGILGGVSAPLGTERRDQAGVPVPDPGPG